MTDTMEVFRPENLGGIQKAADQLAKSTLIPRALQNKPGDVLVVLLTGREFGLQPMQALRGIHVIDGKPVMAADLMVGLCLARKELCEYFSLVETTARKATYKTKRVGQQETTMSWTWEQAVSAKVTTKDNWAKYPDAMLRARCASALARAVYPDLLAGTYDPEELEPTPPAPKPSRAKQDAAPLERAEEPAKSAEAPVVEVLPPEQPVQRAAKQAAPAEVATFERPVDKPALAKEQQAKVESVAAQLGGQVQRGGAAAAGVVAFGPHKGLSIADLTDQQLSELVDLANVKLLEEPKAQWAKKMEANRELLFAEISRRGHVAHEQTQRQPGED